MIQEGTKDTRDEYGMTPNDWIVRNAENNIRSFYNSEITHLKELLREGQDILMGWSRIEDEVHWDEHNQITDEYLKKVNKGAGGDAGIGEDKPQ